MIYIMFFGQTLLLGRIYNIVIYRLVIENVHSHFVVHVQKRFSLNRRPICVCTINNNNIVRNVLSDISRSRELTVNYLKMLLYGNTPNTLKYIKIPILTGDCG